MHKNEHERVKATAAPSAGWRARLHEIVFEADTRAGRFFDFALIWLILLSCATVILESIRHVREQYGEPLYALEWLFTVLFTVEYLLRLIRGSFTEVLRISISSDIFVPFYSLKRSPTTQFVLLRVSLHKTDRQDNSVISAMEITILEKKENLP
jgi:hypothetical protein